MPLSVEELLKPRYKVIADYPGCPYPVGEILIPAIDGELFSESCGYSWTVVKIMVSETGNFPHLIRKLEWWEERDFDLSGMYVRFGDLDKAHSYYKLLSKLDPNENFWNMMGQNGEHCYPISGSVPTTFEEYVNFKFRKTKQ